MPGSIFTGLNQDQSRPDQSMQQASAAQFSIANAQHAQQIGGKLPAEAMRRQSHLHVDSFYVCTAASVRAYLIAEGQCSTGHLRSSQLHECIAAL